MGRAVGVCRPLTDEGSWHKRAGCTNFGAMPMARSGVALLPSVGYCW